LPSGCKAAATGKPTLATATPPLPNVGSRLPAAAFAGMAADARLSASRLGSRNERTIVISILLNNFAEFKPVEDFELRRSSFGFDC
jgi:hypothetical protein